MKNFAVIMSAAMKMADCVTLFYEFWFNKVGCVVVFRPQLTAKVMLGRSVNPSTLFLGRL